jgi:hypothetical protein
MSLEPPKAQRQAAAAAHALGRKERGRLTYFVMLIVCYAGDLDRCKPVQIGTAPSLFECTRVATNSISTWTRDNPGWGFHRIECLRRDAQ